MNAEATRTLMAEYARIREENAREEQSRYARAIAACPEIDALSQARRETIFAGVRLAITGVTPADAEGKVAFYNARIRALLREHGFAEDYLEPVYTCEKCRDTGFVGEGAKAFCDCAREKNARLVFAEMPGGARFEDYDETVFPDETPLPGLAMTQRARMRLIRANCERYADELPAPKVNNLLLYGGSGLGKTFLLQAIYARARERGISALCLTANSLLDVIKEAYFTHAKDGLEQLKTVQLLLVDDLGTEPLIENVTVEQLFYLIDTRMTTGRNTVISTNFTLANLLSRYTERFASRVQDSRNYAAFNFLGEDIRRRRR